MGKPKFSKRWMRFVFYGAAAGVGTLVAFSAVKQKGSRVKKKSKKIVKKARNKIKSAKDHLNERQISILDLFDREDQITNEMIHSVIPDVTKRTLRRDLTFLEEKGYIKKVGRTRGSHYVLN